MSTKKKILTLQFHHETNCFNPNPADVTAFKNCRYQVGEEVFQKQRGIGTEISAFLAVFDKRDDFELIPTVGLDAMPCGKVSLSVYDFVAKTIKDAIKEKGPFDGVLVDFHGAMVAEGHFDGEGDLLEMIRDLVGWDIPIMSSLDLHANVTEKMVKHANVLLPYECYPHIDDYDTGYAVAKIMEQTLDGKIKPVMAYRRIPFLLPLFPHQAEEIKPIYDLTKKMQKMDKVLSARFAHGFFAADIEEMGMSVMIVTDGDKALAESLASQLEDEIKRNIPNLKRKYISLEKALDIIEQAESGPIVLADASDNPGAGAFGDSTHILRAIIERGITGAAVATIRDPNSVEKCEKAGVGNIIDLELGGWSDPKYSGGPLKVKAKIRAITDGNYVFMGKMNHGMPVTHGKAAVIEVAGNMVIVSSVPRQPFDLEVFRSHGIAPERQKVLVVKSAIHYAASYGTIAKAMYPLALDGLASPIPENYQYKNWKGK